MSRVTEQLDRIETILKNNLSSLEGVMSMDFRSLMTKLEKIEKLIDTYISPDCDDSCTIYELEEALEEKEEELAAQEEIIDNNIDYIHFLENELTIRAEENKKLRKKNKKLKKRIKTLQEIVAEDEDAL